jgi:hypothetical protein
MYHLLARQNAISQRAMRARHDLLPRGTSANICSIAQHSTAQHSTTSDRFLTRAREQSGIKHNGLITVEIPVQRACSMHCAAGECRGSAIHVDKLCLCCK